MAAPLGSPRAPRFDIADIVRAHRAEVEQLQPLGAAEKRVLSALALCRTAALGGFVDRCCACGHEHPAYNSCRNRHCPKCQALAQEQWIAERARQLLPARHFHVVFTHRVAISNSRLVDVSPTAVTFRTRGDQKVTLPPVEFLRRFLLHLLPDGFHKIRHYGLYASANARTRWVQARDLLRAEAAPAGSWLLPARPPRLRTRSPPPGSIHFWRSLAAMCAAALGAAARSSASRCLAPLPPRRAEGRTSTVKRAAEQRSMGTSMPRGTDPLAGAISLASSSRSLPGICLPPSLPCL